MRVSVLINNYNYQAFVGRAIESALQQTYEDVEVVVVDDGSRDESLRVIRSFEPRIKVVAQANAGQGSAYNSGFAQSSGQLILFLDADDWLYPQAVTRLIAEWRPGLSKVQFPLTLVDQVGTSLDRLIPRSMSDTAALSLLRAFGTYDSPPGSGNAYSRDFLEKILPLDARAWRIAADTVPIQLAPAFGEIRSIHEPLGAYRLHRRSQVDSLLMNNAVADPWDEYRRISQTKRFVAQAFDQMNILRRPTLLLAPWEARIAVLCVRFGGNVGSDQGPRWRIALRAFFSLIRWPAWGFRKKALQCGWMLLVLLLPTAAARRIAGLHRQAVGAPTSPVATSES